MLPRIKSENLENCLLSELLRRQFLFLYLLQQSVTLRRLVRPVGLGLRDQARQLEIVLPLRHGQPLYLPVQIADDLQHPPLLFLVLELPSVQ